MGVILGPATWLGLLSRGFRWRTVGHDAAQSFRLAGAGQIGHDDVHVELVGQALGLGAGQGGIDEGAGADLVEELAAFVADFVDAQIGQLLPVALQEFQGQAAVAEGPS